MLGALAYILWGGRGGVLRAAVGVSMGDVEAAMRVAGRASPDPLDLTLMGRRKSLIYKGFLCSGPIRPSRPIDPWPPPIIYYSSLLISLYAFSLISYGSNGSNGSEEIIGMK